MSVNTNITGVDSLHMLADMAFPKHADEDHADEDDATDISITGVDGFQYVLSCDPCTTTLGSILHLACQNSDWNPEQIEVFSTVNVLISNRSAFISDLMSVIPDCRLVFRPCVPASTQRKRGARASSRSDQHGKKKRKKKLKAPKRAYATDAYATDAYATDAVATDLKELHDLRKRNARLKQTLEKEEKRTLSLHSRLKANAAELRKTQHDSDNRISKIREGEAVLKAQLSEIMAAHRRRSEQPRMNMNAFQRALRASEKARDAAVAEATAVTRARDGAVADAVRARDTAFVEATAAAQARDAAVGRATEAETACDRTREEHAAATATIAELRADAARSASANAVLRAQMSRAREALSNVTTVSDSEIQAPKIRDNWKSAVDKSGITYYYNRVTGASTWKKPADFRLNR